MESEREKENVFAQYGNVAFYVPHANMLPAAVGSRFSRTSKPTSEVLAEFSDAKRSRATGMIRRLVLDYGHDSAAELAPVFIVISGVSIDAAMYFKGASPHFSIIEESTRYIDFGATGMADVPVVTEADRRKMAALVALYERSKPVVLAHLKSKHLFASSGLTDERAYEEVMDKATLDVVRDALPRGMHTRLCIACNARAFLALLHAPFGRAVSSEITSTIANIRTGFGELYPALAHKVAPKYDVRAPCRWFGRTFDDRFDTGLTLLTPMPEEEEEEKLRDTLHHEVPPTWNATQLELHLNTTFAVFRELDRHRPHIVKFAPITPHRDSVLLPPAIVECGLADEWNAAMSNPSIDTGPLADPLCSELCVHWQVGLAELVHMIELRTTVGAHPAVRLLMQEVARHLLELAPAWMASQMFVGFSENAPNFSRK